MTEKAVRFCKRFKLSAVCRMLGVYVLILSACGMAVEAEMGRTPWRPLLLMGLGGCLLLAGVLINRAVVKQERARLEEQELRKLIGGSAVAAYDLYREEPRRLAQIERLYPEAAWLISQKAAGLISEEILLWYLRETDNCSGRVRPKKTPYSTWTPRKKNTVRSKYGLKRLAVSGSVLATLLILLVVCFAYSVRGPVVRTPRKALGAKVGSYVSLEVRDLYLNAPYREDGGYCYYRWEENTYVSGPPALGKNIYIFRIPETSKERLNYLLMVNDYVEIYGRVVEEEGQVMLDGDVVPETYVKRIWPQPLTGIVALLAAGAGVCTVVFAVKYFNGKEKPGGYV